MGSIYRELMKDWLGIFRALFISLSNLPLLPLSVGFSIRTSLMKRKVESDGKLISSRSL